MNDVHQLLGSSPADSSDWIRRLDESAVPEVKSYSDVVYFNYATLGLSLLFTPSDAYKLKAGMQRSELDDTHLVVDSIDLYNTSTKTFKAFPVSPIIVNRLEITKDMDGKKFVAALGEPDRKGGGTGPSSGSINIWCEWSKVGIHVELEASGPQAWEHGKDAVWKVLTVFRVK